MLLSWRRTRPSSTRPSDGWRGWPYAGGTAGRKASSRTAAALAAAARARHVQPVCVEYIFAREHLLVERLVARHYFLGAEPLVHRLQAAACNPLVQRRVGQQRERAGGHAVEVVGLMQESRSAVRYHFRQAADARRHHRHLAGHRLQRRHAEALLGRRQQAEVGQRQQRHDQLLLTQRLDVVRQPQLPRAAARTRQIRTVPHQQQPRRQTLADAPEQLDHHAGALDRPEVRDVNHQLRLRVSAAVARQQPLVDGPPVEPAVEEVRDDVDLGAHRQVTVRVVAQALGNGGDAVRLIDAERGGLGVRRVAADQRHVRAVQRGDDAGHLAAARRGQDLPREIAGGGVRYRVVGVDDVEVERARHVDQLVRERQQVLRVPKQRVAGRLHLVKREAGLELAEADRPLCADQADLVSAGGKRLGQLRGYDAATADRRVADDADVHGEVMSSRTSATCRGGPFDRLPAGSSRRRPRERCRAAGPSRPG